MLKAFVIAVWLMTMGVLSGCGDSVPKPLPEGTIDVRIKALSGDITEVIEVAKEEALMITFFRPTIWDGKSWTWNFLSAAKAVLSRFNEAAKGVPYKRITFMVRIPTRNNLGQEGRELGMKVTYHLDKLDGAQWDKMTEFDVAELAEEISFRPLGREAATEYCRDNAEYTRRFCAQVGRRY